MNINIITKKDKGMGKLLVICRLDDRILIKAEEKKRTTVIRKEGREKDSKDKDNKITFLRGR